MSADEKPLPLHVQVAMALGWRDCDPRGIGIYRDCNCDDGMLGGTGTPPDWTDPAVKCPRIDIPRYDEDWRETGPLIELYGIGVWYAREPFCEWRANTTLIEPIAGKTPLITVCHLLLALAAAGKLPRSA